MLYNFEVLMWNKLLSRYYFLIHVLRMRNVSAEAHDAAFLTEPLFPRNIRIFATHAVMLIPPSTSLSGRQWEEEGERRERGMQRLGMPLPHLLPLPASTPPGTPPRIPPLEYPVSIRRLKLLFLYLAGEAEKICFSNNIS